MDYSGRKQRSDLFNKCIATITDPVRYVSLWHRGAPIESIGRENVKEWICWAIRYENTGVLDEYEELEEYVHALETLFPNGHEVQSGKGSRRPNTQILTEPSQHLAQATTLLRFGCGGALTFMRL